MAIQRATSYLEDNHADLDRPYDLAIVTYALALVGSPDAHTVNQLLRERATFDEGKHYVVGSVSFCSVLFCSLMFSSVPFCSLLFSSVLFRYVTFCSVPFHSVPFKNQTCYST